MSKNPKVKLTDDEAAVLAAYHSADVMAYIKLMIARHGMDKDEPKQADKPAPAESVEPTPSAAPLPPSHVARERTRARALPPDVRFVMLRVLRDIEQVITDTAFTIMSKRPHYHEAGLFENDVVSDQMLHGIIDFLSLYPSVNQITSEYHVWPHFDIEEDVFGKVLTAYDAQYNKQVVIPIGGSQDED